MADFFIFWGSVEILLDKTGQIRIMLVSDDDDKVFMALFFPDSSIGRASGC